MMDVDSSNPHPGWMGWVGRLPGVVVSFGLEWRFHSQGLVCRFCRWCSGGCGNLMRIQKGLGEADYVYVLLEKKMSEFWFFY